MDARQKQIVDAARACFLQFGYAKTSMDDIAKRAKISRPLVYRAFENKQDIFRAVYLDVFRERFPAALAIAEKRLAKREKILQVIELLVIEPWEEIHGGPMVQEYFVACRELVPDDEKRHKKAKLEIAAALLGDRDAAELFLMSAEGLMLDLPPPATLRKRITALVDRFL